MTERAQRSLIVALQYHYGGAPEGPFGTGKTETTKDLARAFGRQCYVLNTSASYEYDNVVKFFKGVCATPAWVCFDEFNRLESNVLSFLSSVILTINTGLKAGFNFVHLDDSKTSLSDQCAIFITTNPGYAGRSQLPINLKNLFRTVNMVIPDSAFISEILLYAAGFKNAPKLSSKLC
jgi:dynein heavy chain